ncbi:MAG: LLM class flavin-dependent oxidoreductase [Thermomicrobiales bacterium]
MPAPISIGIMRNFSIPWPELVESWQRIDRTSGIDSVWGVDHFIRPVDPSAPHFDAWTTLAALGALTNRVRIGILVTNVLLRHPALLAKMAITVDHTSNGRLEIALGAGGWPPEHETFGIPYPATGERVAHLEESVALIDLLLRQEISTFQGGTYQVSDAPMRPGPVQLPRPPITIGGQGPRMLRLAAKSADRWNSYGTVEEMRERSERLTGYCLEIGRDPGTIIRSFYGSRPVIGFDVWESPDAFAEGICRYIEGAGITEFILEPPTAQEWPMAERILAETLPKLNS